MFGGGGGGLNPRKMQQMMKQMGIDFEELDAEEVVIKLGDEELVFGEDVEVTRMDAQGTMTYQVVGEPETREKGAGSDESASDDDSGGSDIPDDDVEIVAMRAGVSEEVARNTLEETDGDLAAAVERLE